MPSEIVRQRLRWEDAGGRPQSAGVMASLLEQAGLVPFPAVIRTFAEFGGGRFRTSEGWFKLHDARAAVKLVRRCPGLPGYQSDDPVLFRIPFGESETVQAWYLLDGDGHVFEDSRRVAESLGDWLEILARV